MTSERLREILDGFPNQHVLVVGDVMLDHYLWGATKRISPEAPVPVVSVESETYRPGGAANVAYNLRILGSNVTIAGLIGKDDNATHLTNTLSESGVNTSGLIIDPTRPTTTKTRVMGHTQYRQQQQMLRVDRETAIPIDDKLLKPLMDAITNAQSLGAVFVSDYAKGVVTLPFMDAIRQIQKTHHYPIIADPKGRNFDKYHGVTAISPNQSEALGAFNLDEADDKTVIEIGHRLIKQFELTQVYMTRSEKGVALFEQDGQVTHIPATARDVFDVSGAGDTTAAVYTLALLSNASPPEAAYIGNLAGGIVVGKVGVDTVSIDEIIEAHILATNA
ncbi:MAG: D-glycero-beta-D-manno-heptose-7-phosphate kinase [Candidatus Latescibacteria bacterium]|jgi:rfaE bifunctional protein kinase chain/domain|nr:D-glycero-beta-D-manno-heptose-7-phosphate kinase [Candidatus Latescibacterota bacterium]